MISRHHTANSDKRRSHHQGKRPLSLPYGLTGILFFAICMLGGGALLIFLVLVGGEPWRPVIFVLLLLILLLVCVIILAHFLLRPLVVSLAALEKMFQNVLGTKERELEPGAVSVEIDLQAVFDPIRHELHRIGDLLEKAIVGHGAGLKEIIERKQPTSGGFGYQKERGSPDSISMQPQAGHFLNQKSEQEFKNEDEGFPGGDSDTAETSSSNAVNVHSEPAMAVSNLLDAWANYRNESGTFHAAGFRCALDQVGIKTRVWPGDELGLGDLALAVGRDDNPILFLVPSFNRSPRELAAWFESRGDLRSPRISRWTLPARVRRRGQRVELVEKGLVE